MEAHQHPVDLSNTAVAFAHYSNRGLLRAYGLFYIMTKRRLVKWGSLLAKLAFQIHLPVKALIRHTFFNHFCGGETLDECQKKIHQLGEYGVETILDYSVEGEDDESVFENNLQQLIATVEMAAGSDHIPFAVFKVTGIGRSKLLEKVQAQSKLTQSEQMEYSRLKERIQILCERANALQVRIFFDAEESWIQNAIDDLCYEMMAEFNRTEPLVFNTYQFYRKDMLFNFRQAFENALSKGFHLGAKLVRGAYLEKEISRAEKIGYPNPIHSSKEGTDQDYNEAILFSLHHLSNLAICVATHNEMSCQLAMREMTRLDIDKNDKRVYFAQLLGMRDNISFNMALAGYNVAKYVPFGPIKAVMPYLLRRAEENSAIAGQSNHEFYLIRQELRRRSMR